MINKTTNITLKATDNKEIKMMMLFQLRLQSNQNQYMLMIMKMMSGRQFKHMM